MALQYILPQHALSRLAGKAMECSWQPWKNFIITRFIKTYKVDMSNAVETNPTAYANFNAFFTRQLQPQARPITPNNQAIVCPADGCISQIGDITNGRIIQAKGFDFTVNELLGGDTDLASSFEQGKFATIYLAPKDYHRVHMPLTGTLRRTIYIPGKLFSVNQTTSESVPRLFARNERVACIFDTDVGPMAVIMVGAFFVASIDLVWHGTVTPPRGSKIVATDYQPGLVRLNKGAEMGYFKLGSTAIVLFPDHKIQWQAGLTANTAVQMGQPLGSIL